MYALVLNAIWECTRSTVVHEFAHAQRFRLYTNRKFGVIRPLPPKVAEFL